MRLPRILPLDWVGLRSTTTKEIAFFLLLGALFLIMALFEPYNTEQPYSSEDPDTVRPSRFSLSERLGTAILLNAGYKRFDFVDEKGVGSQDKGARVGSYDGLDQHPDLNCIYQAGGDTLTTAIIAAEKYNRSPFQRRVEAWFARLALKYFGKLPDFSLGLAQIKPSVARKILDQELGQFDLQDSDLLELLLDDCHNSILAMKYIHSLSQQSKSARTEKERVTYVAQNYNGALTRTIHGLRYVDAVLGAYSELGGGFDEEISEGDDLVGRETQTTEPLLKGCADFPVSNIESSIEWIRDYTEGKEEDKKENEEESKDPESLPANFTKKMLASNGTLKVRVSISNDDPGPVAYVERLSQLRTERLRDRLVKLGFTRENIFVKEFNSATGDVNFCADGGDPPSFATIEITADREVEGRKSVLSQAVREQNTSPSELQTRGMPHSVKFDFASTDIKPESLPVLEKTVVFLQKHPDIQILITGHTDTSGRHEANAQRISELRAESVKRYLVGKGIASNRLATIGLGNTQPIAPNVFPDGRNNPEGRAANRRVELKMLTAQTAQQKESR